MGFEIKEIMIKIAENEHAGAYSKLKRANGTTPSFKGAESLLYKKAAQYNVNDFLDFSKKYLGNMGGELFENLKNSPYASKMLSVDGNTMTFFDKKWYKLVYDGAVYPFLNMPFDIINGILKTGSKISKKLFNKDPFQHLLNTKFLKNAAMRSKTDSNINILQGMVSQAEKLKGKMPEEIKNAVFQMSSKMFSPKTGNYDTKYERTINRLVSGLPPAIFLANDAYNLSNMMDGNDKKAQKERKARFFQEVKRIGLSAYITFITLGALQKIVNKSMSTIVATTGLTVLLTETYSRLSGGKRITRLTPEEAKKINEENGENLDVKIKKTVSKANIREPLLSPKTLIKALLAVIATGFSFKFLRGKMPSLDKFLKDIPKKYEQMCQIDYKVSKKEFDNVLKTLKEGGFPTNEYEKIASKITTADGEFIDFGKRFSKNKILYDFLLAPLKFTKKMVSLPYTLTDSLLKACKILPTAAKKVAPVNDAETLGRIFDKLSTKMKAKNFDIKDFMTYAETLFKKSFDVNTMSAIPNNELSNVAKQAATAATMWFLMTDNYNMVMLKSNGQDVEGAKTKFRERFTQEISRLFYQTLLIDLFNSTFRSQYNGSLFGMSWITATNTTLGEALNRVSVGMPIKPCSKAELLQMEKDQKNAKGFKKTWFNFMSRLTGKRSIGSYSVNQNRDFSYQKAKQNDILKMFANVVKN